MQKRRTLPLVLAFFAPVAALLKRGEPFVLDAHLECSDLPIKIRLSDRVKLMGFRQRQASPNRGRRHASIFASKWCTREPIRVAPKIQLQDLQGHFTERRACFPLKVLIVY